MRVGERDPLGRRRRRRYPPGDEGRERPATARWAPSPTRATGTGWSSGRAARPRSATTATSGARIRRASSRGAWRRRRRSPTRGDACARRTRARRAHDRVRGHPGPVGQHCRVRRAARAMSRPVSRAMARSDEARWTARGRMTIASTNPYRIGKVTNSVTNAGHPSAGEPSASQPIVMSRTWSRATRLRRRLSIIFQRCSAESGLTGQAPARVAHSERQPRQRLPVAARPAVHARLVRREARRVVVEDFDVGRERRSQERALDEVVREQRVLGEALFQHAEEHAELEDALAGEAALAEHVLVGVRGGADVGVEPCRARVHPGVQALARPRQGHAHARLHEPVAGLDARLSVTPPRAVERIRDRRDELARAVPGQLGVGVERDDERHVAPERRVAHLVREAGAALAV